ncbi:MAG: 3D domain-containing protein [Planctomycetia bacterium]|nr:3D domain-containing protein [Planctomycetia bacterium]
MRHSRPLTKSENWELAVLMLIMLATLLILALAWRFSRMPHLWAIAPPPGAMAISNPSNIADSSYKTAFQSAPSSAQPVMAQISMRPQAPAPAKILPHRLIRPRYVHRRVSRPVDSYWYHGRRYIYWKTLDLRVTSYAPDRKCCLPYPGTTTASGESVWTNGGHLVAADTRLIPFHCMVRVPGYDYDRPVPVLDRGGAIRGYRLDVLSPTFWGAQQWGVKFLAVRIYRPVARW